MAIIRTAGWVPLLLAAAFLPFLPGRHDPLAASLAAAAAVAAFGGLLLVPIGVAWLIGAPGYGTARLAVLVGALIVSAASVALSTNSLIAGAALVLLGLARLLRLWRALDASRTGRTSLPRTIPIALTVVPLVVTTALWVLAEPVAAWSRSLAIANASEYIRAIEQFRERTGAYPVALNSLWPDYQPGIIAIERFRYEPAGESYNLYFEHPSTTSGLREIVMYNPAGEQDFSSHVLDLLELSPDQIRRQRGYFSSEDLPEPRWKRFLFD